jgi:hypothetical protein
MIEDKPALQALMPLNPLDHEASSLRTRKRFLSYQRNFGAKPDTMHRVS